MQLKAGHENIKKKGMKADTVWAWLQRDDCGRA